MKTNHDYKQITEIIIGCAYRVSNQLGCGFLEKVYENALSHEIQKENLTVTQQCPINVWYDEIVVGEYVADLIVNGNILIELKTVRQFDEVHVAQCLNYLKATHLPLCLLINFGTPKVQIKRIRA
ncbi:MAG: GxxExxY protein [Phycisphaeraceae bacterium JB051]